MRYKRNSEEETKKNDDTLRLTIGKLKKIVWLTKVMNYSIIAQLIYMYYNVTKYRTVYLE